MGCFKVFVLTNFAVLIKLLKIIIRDILKNLYSERYKKVREAITVPLIKGSCEEHINYFLLTALVRGLKKQKNVNKRDHWENDSRPL